MFRTRTLHLVVFVTVTVSVVASHIVKSQSNNDNQPGQSRHDGKRAMDSMYKGMMESFKTSFVPGSKKDDGNTDASPSDWKNMIPGFAKGFIPDSAEDGTDNSTVSEDAVADPSATNATSVDIEGAFHVNAAIKDDESVGEEKMTSQDGSSPDSTALPAVLSTDDNVPSEFGLLTHDNDLASTDTQSSETEAMETPADMTGKQDEQGSDMAQSESDLAEKQAKEPPADTETNVENTETDLTEQEPSSDTRKSMFLKVAMRGKASLKKDGETAAEAAEEDTKETVI
ncbi:uncharacterized protein LOC110441690 [Mizuhopecten yessoensis]|uniref:Uncharacterized protein n=1 Tax=Mizuhopecten yessoensis TaxID=6573 RepID=A0A210PIY9_MIZYE|nr:uncharacterized protein LOC110441690 [Mizuhopecten yessoensis]OWF36433.1 hypothetical protein KP79_PYT03189 [Mizuhopecten yessoensis]